MGNFETKSTASNFNQSDLDSLQRQIANAAIYYEYMENIVASLQSQIAELNATMAQTATGLQQVQTNLDTNYMTVPDIKNELEKIYQIIS